MNIFSFLRKLRHGPLRILSPLWLFFGRLYRKAITYTGLKFTVRHCIGPYGPFQMLPEFAFSDFANWGKEHNSGFIACIEACQSKTCVLDIGAHIGLVTMPMSKAVGPQGRVIAVEPSPANRLALSQHLSLNKLTNVLVIDTLIGDKVLKEAAFYEDPAISGMNSCTPVKTSSRYAKTSHPQTTIDNICKNYGLQPDIIKIDVEGWELSVLEGAIQVLKEFRPTIFLSVHPQHLESLQRDANELPAFLDPLGYRISDIAGDVVQQFKLDEYLITPKTK